MSEKKSGRKKHMVSGEVKEIKKSVEGLGVDERVGESGFMSVIRKLLKGMKK